MQRQQNLLLLDQRVAVVEGKADLDLNAKAPLPRPRTKSERGRPKGRKRFSTDLIKWVIGDGKAKVKQERGIAVLAVADDHLFPPSPSGSKGGGGSGKTPRGLPPPQEGSRDQMSPTPQFFSSVKPPYRNSFPHLPPSLTSTTFASVSWQSRARLVGLWLRKSQKGACLQRDRDGESCCFFLNCERSPLPAPPATPRGSRLANRLPRSWCHGAMVSEQGNGP